MFASTIHKDDSYDANSYTYYPVVVIGAGESGIAMGCRMKEVLSFDQFRIFDRQSGIGGTWWINRYPGVACDIPAIFYSFSWAQNPNWTTFHPEGKEIVRYLQGVCEKYKIVDKIQLNTDVKECRWNEKEGIWDVTLLHMVSGIGDLTAHERRQRLEEQGPGAVYLHEEQIKAKVVVSSVGGLVEPKLWPESIPGRDKFQGEIFHSARWKYDVDLKDKDVVVVGTGCSAAQFVPRLPKEYGAKSVTQIMRSPPWVVPKLQPPVGEALWEEWGSWYCKNIPGFQAVLRFLIFISAEHSFIRLFRDDEYSKKGRKLLEADLIARMKKTVPQKYWEILTPDYDVCCKRRIVDSTWLPSLNDPKIELTTLKLSNIGEKSVTLGPHRAYPSPNDETVKAPNHQVTIPADVIILANGFETTQWFHPLSVVGREGQNLSDVFRERDGAQMYMGMAMDGFPNFFTIFGPNTVTGHSSVILASENMVEMILKFIKPIIKGDVAEVEITKEAELEWAADIQRACKKTVVNSGGCNNWYHDDSGWNSTTYPYTQIWFGLRCMFPTWSDWSLKYTPQGLARKRRRALIRYVLYAAALVGVICAKQNGYMIRDSPILLKAYLKWGVLMGAKSLQHIASKV